MATFRDLRVWQKAHGWILKTYNVSQKFPVVERFGLTSQLRRAAVSVAANIVEGCKRRSSRDYAHFLSISEGSLEEAEIFDFIGF